MSASSLFQAGKTTFSFCLHYADANELEIAANGAILEWMEQMSRSRPIKDLKMQTKVFADVIIEGRMLLRLENRSEIPISDGLDFSLRDFLTHTLIHYWPFPDPTCCPCAFCDCHGDGDDLESHLEEVHPPIAQLNCFHSEVQLAMAGLLGVLPKTNKVKRWKCPFSYCVAEFDKYSEIADHILNQRAHKKFEQYLYTQLGGFWASILVHLNETGN
jgi:hypothetical protein